MATSGSTLCKTRGGGREEDQNGRMGGAMVGQNGSAVSGLRKSRAGKSSRDTSGMKAGQFRNAKVLDTKGHRYDTEPFRILRTSTAGAAFGEPGGESKMERVRFVGHAVETKLELASLPRHF